VPTYFLLISTLGAVGAALAVSCIYAVYALGAIWSLRATPRLTAGRVT
jgi:O-antigen/teichoic acid export membrane protein